MNKDAIYIEPEDDITDILTKIKEIKGETAALVPPKKAGVLRSAVNFKLIAKTAKEAGKTPVLVTNDESLVKLAGAVQMRVAKNLQSEPVEPVELKVTDGTVTDEEVIEGAAAEKVAMESEVAGSAAAAIVSDVAAEDFVANGAEDASLVDAAEATDAAVVDQKERKAKKSRVAGLEKYRKLIIVGAIALVAIIGFLVWALVFAPAATIRVTVDPQQENFSENVSFVLDEAEEDAQAGVFWLEEQKLVKTSEVEFEATGEVDKGAKATGMLTLRRTSPVSVTSGALTVPKGTKFSLGDKSFVTNEAVTLAGPTADNCDQNFGTSNCDFTRDITAMVPVTAEFGGEGYNIAASSSGWGPTGRGYTISSSAMTGGTSKIVKVVSEEDIKKAQEALADMGESEGRTELLANFPAGLMPLTASFAMKAAEPVSTPALDAEVGEDVTPKLVAETTLTIFGVNRARVNMYISEQSLRLFGEGTDAMKIYSTGVSEEADKNKAFMESFRKLGDEEGDAYDYAARLKSTVLVGPEVTDDMVVERSLGRKIGEVQSNLKSISGVGTVDVDTSFFWVTSVPKDINKVNVEIVVE